MVIELALGVVLVLKELFELGNESVALAQIERAKVSKEGFIY